MDGESRRIKSFIIGGILAAIAISIGIGALISAGEVTNLLVWLGIGVMAFTFSSCIVLDNNFIGDVFLDILNWGFVQMPGVIFTLDLDGIVFLLTVKLLFWILGFILAIICGILAFVVASALSVFVYPFAIIKNIRNTHEF